MKTVLCILLGLGFTTNTFQVVSGAGLLQAKRQPTQLFTRAALESPKLREDEKEEASNTIPREDTVPPPVPGPKPPPGLPALPPMPNIPEMPVLRPVVFINPNETEAERAERIHRAFEKLMTFVDIMGQVDNYVGSKMKSFVKSVTHFYEGKDEEDADNVVGDSKPACLQCPKCSRN